MMATPHPTLRIPTAVASSNQLLLSFCAEPHEIEKECKGQMSRHHIIDCSISKIL